MGGGMWVARAPGLGDACGEACGDACGDACGGGRNSAECMAVRRRGRARGTGACVEVGGLWVFREERRLRGGN